MAFTNQQWKYKNVWNLLKVKNKDARRSSMTAEFKLQYIY